MKIKSIRAVNFRAIKDETLICDDLTALVGANGAGKSSFLRALLVFQGRQKPTAEDFYNRDTDEDVKIAVTFTDLPGAASKRFAKYVRDGDLEVVRVCRHNDGAVASSLHGVSPSNSGFDGVRTAPRVADALRRYDGLRQDPRYSGLPKCSTGKAAREELGRWEDANPDRCDRPMDDGSFFGFGESARGDLGRFVNILYVPAVREATWDGAEGRKGSTLRSLLDLTVKNGLAASIRRQDEMDAAGAVYTEAHHKADLPDPERQRDGINDTLGMLVRGAEVDYHYDLELILDRPAAKRGTQDAEADSDYLRLLADLPPATLRLSEDGYSTTIDRTGHGLQRAFIIAMLGRLHRAQAGASASATDVGVGDDDPSVVLVLEEPELYQHPARMRHLAGLFRSMSQNGLDGVADRIQVVYTTHSPYFVFADRIDQIRLVRKEGGRDGKPGTTRMKRTTSAAILAELKHRSAAYAPDGAIDYSLLRAMGPAASEGFFADAVVLTEGPSDRIALLGVAEVMGRSLDALGVSVISCGSKLAIPLPLVMFRRLGMPVYAVWDADKNTGSQKKDSERIVSALGYGGADWRGMTTGSFACLPGNLEDVIRSDLNKALGADVDEDPYESMLNRRRKKYGLGRLASKLIKTHLVMEEVEERGIHLERLESIVGEITKLPGGLAPE